MRFGIEYEEDTVKRIVEILRRFEGGKVSIFEIEKECLKEGVVSTDYLFLMLQHFGLRGIIEASKGSVEFKGVIDDGMVKEVSELIRKRIAHISKIFLTPLEVAKFYQCPRRFWLEKIVLSKQKKEKSGKVWDGEALHVGIKKLIEDLDKKEESILVRESAEYGIKSYNGLVEVSLEEMENMIKNFYSIIKEENFDLILPERTIVSLKFGLIGSIDIIAFKNEEIIPIEIKHASYRGKIKREHFIQLIGETILVSSYFRKRIKNSYIFYSQTNDLVKANIRTIHLKNFMGISRVMKRIYASDKIPPKSKLPNYRERVCKGCHVREACDNIEKIKKFR